MRQLLVLLSLVVAVGFTACRGLATQAAESRKPNILLIVADDLGWKDVGYHGSDIKTPALDRLARESVQLDRFYVYPSCSPTRACLLSGRNAARFGIPGPIATDSPLCLPLKTKSLASLLKGRGYDTALIGKWHLGNTNTAQPRQHGFDSFYGYHAGQIDQFRHEFWGGEPIWMRNETLISDEGHVTDLLEREAKSWLKQRTNAPFFMMLCFSVPHYPLQAPQAWLDRYSHIADPDRRIVAAMVSQMDAAIGNIVKTLEEQDKRDDTLIIFVSDNGGQKDWLFNRYGGKHGPYKTLGNNAPLRGWKTELYEGGVRVLGFMNWPGGLKPGTLRDVTHACDIFPTVAHLAGGPEGIPPEVEGIDISKALRGDQKLPARTFHWNIGSHVGLLDGNYKLISRRRGQLKPGEATLQLFDLEKDPFETSNLAEDHADVLRRLQEKLTEELRKDEHSRAALGIAVR